MKKKSKLLIALLVIIFAGIYYYVTLPAINLHSTDTWFFVIALIVALMVFYALRKKIGKAELKTDKGLKTFITIILALGIAFLVGTILSSPIVNARKYQKHMTVEEGDFAKDVEELSYDKIPLLDKDTAALLGDRIMGSMVDMVSQFEADLIYSQIN